jgi:hypothetical protein
MKHLTTAVATFALAVVAGVTTVPPRTAAAAGSGGAIAAFCRQYAGSTVSINMGGIAGEFAIPAGQGGCVSFVASAGPSICKGDDVFGSPGYELLGFKNRGECVSRVQREAREVLEDFPGAEAQP